MDKLKAIFHVIGMILIPMIIFNGFIYLFGCFIAWDINPMHWWLFTSIPGRILYAILFIGCLSNVSKFWEEFGD